MRDVQAGTTTLVSVDTAGDGGGDNYSYAPVISADGSLVAFDSSADNLAAGTTNPNNYQNVYLRNWQAGTPTTTMVSANSTGTTSGNNNSNTPAFGWSSTRLVFQTLPPTSSPELPTSTVPTPTCSPMMWPRAARAW